MIEEIHRDVLSFTNDVLALNNSSRPKIDTEDDFYGLIEKMRERRLYNIPEGFKPRAIIDDDFVIHIPQSDFYREWSVGIIAFFQPYSFFFEKTNFGRQLRESGKVEALRERYSSSIDGLGRWVEIKTFEWLKTKDYNFEKIKSEIYRELRESQDYKFFEISEKLWKDSRNTDLSRLIGPENPKDKVFAAGIIYAGEDRFGDFNEKFLELETMSIPDILVESGLYRKLVEKPEKQKIPPEEVEIVEKYIKELGILIAVERPIGDIRESLKKTGEKLLELGRDYKVGDLITFGERALASYKVIEGIPSKFRIEEKVADPTGYTMELQDFLMYCGNFFKPYKQEVKK